LLPARKPAGRQGKMTDDIAVIGYVCTVAVEDVGAAVQRAVR
jgi:hypothetical protein